MRTTRATLAASLAVLALLASVAGGCTYTQDFAAPAAGGDAGTVTDGAVCTSTEDDPANCGVCGHSCLGGACSSGRCEALVLAEGLGTSGGQSTKAGPTSVVVDAQNAYWINDSGTLMRVSLDGGEPTKLANLNAYIGAFPQLVITRDAIFAGPSQTATYALIRVAKEGGVVTRLVPSEVSVRSFGLAGDDLFVAADRGGETLVYRCALAGCPSPLPEPLFVQDKAMELDGIVATPSALFVSMFPKLTGSGQARIERRNRSTGAVIATVGATAPRYGDPVADATSIFSSNFTYIVRTAMEQPSGAPPIGFDKYVISGNEVRVGDGAIVPDDQHLYWAEYWGPRRVVRCHKDGCSRPEILWSSKKSSTAKDFDGTPGAVDGAMGLGVNENAIVFTTGDGRVLKLAKPPATPVTR